MADPASLQRQVEALTAEVRHLRQVLDDTPGVYVFRQHQPADGGPRTYTFASAPLTARFGPRAGSAANLIERVHPEDAPRTRAALEAAVATRTPLRLELRLRDLQGRDCWVLATASPTPAPDGSTIWNGAFTDITDRVETEHKYRDLYTHTPALLHSIDPEGRIIGVSERWLETLGYAREEVLGRRSVEFLTPESRRRAIEEVLPAFFRSGVCQDVPYQYVTKDGRVIDALLSAIAERDEAGRVTRSMAVIVDVTERRRAEEALRASEARYRALIETAPDAIVLLDELGRVVDANQNAAALLGRPTGAGAPGALGVDLAEGAADGGASLRACVQAALAGEPQTFDLILARPAGGEAQCEVRLVAFERPGAPLVRASMVDVSARRRAEAAIRDGQRRLAGLTGEPFLRALVEELARVLGVRWVLAGRVTRPGHVRTVAMWADGALAPDIEYALAGTPCAEVLGQSLCAFPSGIQERFPADALLQAMGAHCYMGAPMHASAGEPLGLVAVLHDAPRAFDEATRSLLAIYATRAGAELERMAAEERVRALNAALERRVEERTAELATSNRELEAFAYAVSHDLRAPLRAIHGFTHALQEESGDRLDAEGQDHLRRVLAASERMGHLIDDLLDLSRVVRHGEIERVPVDVGALAAAAFDELRRVQPARRVELEVQPGLVAEADPGLTRSLVVNLVDNAWKFTARRAPAHIQVGARRERGRAVFFVRDDGAGFDPAAAHRLFTPFQRLHAARDYEGNGIGLATAQRIARRHGGDVWAEARPDEGATFYFTLEPARSA